MKNCHPLESQLVEADILFYNNKNYQQFSLCFVLRNIALLFFTLRDQPPFLQQQQKMERILTLMNFENGNYGGCVFNVEMLAENN